MPLYFSFSDAVAVTLMVLAIALIFNAGVLVSRWLRARVGHYDPKPVGLDDICLNLTAASLLVMLAKVAAL